MTPRRASPVVLPLFFLSGATGLVYQVVWIRWFGREFGSTVLAISTVLAAFMAGLALGGLWSGRRAGRWRRPLVAYGWMEAGLAALAAGVPLLLAALDPLYGALYRAAEGSPGALTAARFVTSVLVLLPPTFLMGATLPALVREAERGGVPSRRRAAVLYAVNTFGAVAGTALAGFVLLPAVGVRGTLAIGVATNAIVAVTALLAGRAAGREEPTPPPATRAAPPGPAADGGDRSLPFPRPLLAFAAGALGFGALAFEVLWTRALALSLGTTTYAYSVVLCVFLLGIALGGLVAAGMLRGGRRPVGAFVAAPALVGLAALALLPLFDRLPELFVALAARGGGTWGASVLARVLLAGLPLLPPTLVSGAALPLAVGIDSRSAAHRSAGDLFAANTLGAIVGSWAAGFVLLPALGLQRGVETIAVGLVVVGAALALAVAGPGRARRGALAALALAGAVALVVVPPAWNRDALTRGSFVLGLDVARVGAPDDGAADPVPADDLVFVREGVTSTVTVRREDGEYAMQINGVTEASTGGDLSTQVSVAALPLLVHGSAADALVIGFGGGISAATCAAWPGVRSIEIVEISEAVIEADTWFREANGGVLSDPRVRLVLGDGRNHLRLADRTWDVIVSLPSHVWNAGIGGLLSREFFAEASAKLRPGGVLCSWVQGYSVSPDALRSVLAAARTAFPRVSLWRGAWGDLLVVAGDESLAVDATRIAAVLDGARRDGGPLAGRLAEGDCADPLAVLSRCLLAGDAVAGWTGGFPANSDDRPFLEFEAPKLLYRDTMRALFDGLYEVATGPAPVLVHAPVGLESSLGPALRARALESEARLAFREGRGEDALARLREARALLPASRSIARTLSNGLLARGASLANAGRLREAGETFVEAVRADPQHADAWVRLGEIHRDTGGLDRALEAAERARDLDPSDPDPPALAADVLGRMRRFDEAVAAAREALARDPSHEGAFVALGDAWLGLGETARAESTFAAGLARRPGSGTLAQRLRKTRSLETRPR